MDGPRRGLDDFTAEIEAHLALEIERLRDEGLSEEDAAAEARRRFGNVTHARERFYESRRWLWWDRVAQDVRYGARMLRRSPAFTFVAALTVAVGVGATTAIFSVVDATLLHPLPYPDAGELVSVVDDLPGVGAYDVGLSQPEWLDLERSGIFRDVSPDWFDENNLTGSSRPARVRLMSVGPAYFELLGVAPQIGRAFPPRDHSPGYLLEVVISDGLWTREFGRDPRILQKAVRLDTDLYRIVGVMPPGFHAPGRTLEERNVDVWAATSFYGAPIVDNPPRNVRNLPTTIARLAPGLTVAAAQQRVDALVAALRQAHPADYPAASAWRVRLVPLQDTVVGDVRRSLVLLLGAVGLVLLIGCVNLANLMVARATARGREIAVRQAMGAGRRRLVRQLLTESLLLSLIGGVAGVAILMALQGVLLRLVPDTLPRLNELSISWSVLLFAGGATFAAGAIAGLAPALHAGRIDVTTMLRLDSRGSTAPGRSVRARQALVVTEFALSLVLLVAAGLLLRSFRDLVNVPLGFHPADVMTIRTRLPYPNIAANDRYATVAQQAPFFREILRRVRTLPGVEEAALGNTTAIPLDHAQKDVNLLPLFIEGRPVYANDTPRVHASLVTPEYFHLLGIAPLTGRLLADSDIETTPAAAVINEAMAQAYWPGASPLGRHIRLSRTATSWIAIVGVVPDARTESLAESGVPEVFASVYQPIATHPPKHLALFLRGHVEPAAAADAVREQVQIVDPALPVFGAQVLTETVAASLAERRFAMELVGAFAATALVLAALGIYGVISYMVGARTHEIGLRLALGAQRGGILAMVLQQGLALVTMGTAVGLVCALIVSEAMAGLLYGIRPADPATFAGVTALFAAVALLACYVPARRAIRIDPMEALRDQ
ncbi:MAG TPA: ABC transporter permease [Vicinamibacterales bacterium]|nr:ABC transporter permease [Vicinamibacterales bacterium]